MELIPRDVWGLIFEHLRVKDCVTLAHVHMHTMRAYMYWLRYRECDIDNRELEYIPTNMVALHLYNASIDKMNEYFQHACMVGIVHIAKWLLPRVDPTNKEDSAMESAVVGGHVDIVRLLANDPRIDVCNWNNDAIERAVEYGSVEICKILIRAGADPSCNDSYSFRTACDENHYKVAKLLLKDSRVNPTARNNAAFRCAVGNNNVKMVKMLMEVPPVSNSIDVNEYLGDYHAPVSSDIKCLLENHSSYIDPYY
jgi:Ankyrin repeats (3 copies)